MTKHLTSLLLASALMAPQICSAAGKRPQPPTVAVQRPALAGAVATTHSATLNYVNPNPGSTITVLSSTSCAGSFSTLASGVASSGSYVDANVTAAKTYAFEIEAVVGGTVSAPSNCVSGTIPVFGVTALSVAPGADNTQAVVSWIASTDAGTSVTVAHAAGVCGPGTTYSVDTTTAPAGGPYTVIGLSTATSYCVAVTASVGGVSSAAATFQFSSGITAPTLTIVVQ